MNANCWISSWMKIKVIIITLNSLLRLKKNVMIFVVTMATEDFFTSNEFNYPVNGPW